MNRPIQGDFPSPLFSNGYLKSQKKRFSWIFLKILPSPAMSLQEESFCSQSFEKWEKILGPLSYLQPVSSFLYPR